LWDYVLFKHEVFIRVTRSFPSLKYLFVNNRRSPIWRFIKPQLIDNDWCSIVEYPHLISLDISFANIDYVEHFLNETKTHLPCVTELQIRYEQMITMTEMQRKAIVLIIVS